MKINLITFCFSLTSMAACNYFSPKTPRPATPEAVVRQWQAHIDRNEFEQARQLSNGEALTYIGTLDTIDFEEIVFLKLHCTENNNTAVCDCLLEFEDGEHFPGKFTLERVNGQWFVTKTHDSEEIRQDSLFEGDEELIFPGDSTDQELE